MVRALTSHQCGLGSIPAQYFMWVEFVFGPRPAPRVFLLILWFSSLQENHANTLNSNPTRLDDLHGNQLRLMWLCFKLIYLLYLLIYWFVYLLFYLFIYLFIYVAGTTKILHELQLVSIRKN